MISFASVLFLIMITFCSLSSKALAAVLGIDYGSEFLKISIVAPGRTPITLVINEISKRKTTIAVSFVNEDRWVGEEAMNYQARFPEKVASRLRELLGKKVVIGNDLSLYSEKYKLPFDVLPTSDDKVLSTATTTTTKSGDDDDVGRQTVMVSIEDQTHTIEELVATTLQYAMKIGGALGKGAIKDAVVSVPPYFSQTQRRAIYDAADIAGLNVMALVSDVSCAALQWGIDKDFAKNETKNVIIFDVGSAHSSASLVEFGALSEKRSKKTYGSFVVKQVQWNEDAGGEDLDVLLVDHFLNEFKEKHAKETENDVTTDKRAVAKLRKQVRKTKEMLSANKDAPVSVEGMFEDIDFRSSIDRETFETLAEKTFQRMLEPLRRLVDIDLPKLGLTLQDIEAVEVIGGSVRIPGIQRLIEEEVLKGEKTIDKHLDADEAVAMGAGLFAANMSTTFRMRKFGAADALPYGIDYEVLGQVATATSDDSNNNNNNNALFSRNDPYPSRSKVTIENVTANEFILKTFIAPIIEGEGEDAKAKLVLPPAWESADIATFNVSGVDAIRAKYNDTEAGNVTVTFAMDPSGIFFVEKAQFEVIVTDMVEIPRPKKEEKKDKKSKKNITIETTTTEKSEDDSAEDAEKKTTTTTTGDDAGDNEDSSSVGEKLEEEETTKEEAKEGDKANSAAEEKEDDVSTSASNKEEETKEEEEEEEEEDKKEEKVEEEVYIPQFRERKRKFKHDLLVSESNNPIVQMSNAEIASSKKKLELLHAKDQAKRETEAAKSNLEAYIYSSRSKVRQDEEIEKVTTEEQRENHLASLEEAEDWLYTEEGEHANKTAYESKHGDLMAVSDAFIFRAKESSLRPESLTYAKKWIAETKKNIATWKEKKPYIFANETEPLLKDIDELVAFLEEKEKEQENKEPHEDPAFSSKEVKGELSKRMTKYKKLKAKPAPKVEKPKTNSTNTTKGGKNSTSSSSSKKKSKTTTTSSKDEESNKEETTTTTSSSTASEDEAEDFPKTTTDDDDSEEENSNNISSDEDDDEEETTGIEEEDEQNEDPPLPNEPEPTEKKKSWFGKVFEKKEPTEAASGDL